MSSPIWQSPVPSSSFDHGVQITHLPGRRISVTATYESDDGELGEFEAVFSGVAKVSIIYQAAIDAKTIRAAYDSIVLTEDDEEVSLCREIIQRNKSNQKVAGYLAYFDGGPALKIVAEGFQVTTREGTKVTRKGDVAN